MRTFRNLGAAIVFGTALYGCARAPVAPVVQPDNGLVRVVVRSRQQLADETAARAAAAAKPTPVQTSFTANGFTLSAAKTVIGGKDVSYTTFGVAGKAFATYPTPAGEAVEFYDEARLLDGARRIEAAAVDFFGNPDKQYGVTAGPLSPDGTLYLKPKAPTPAPTPKTTTPTPTPAPKVAPTPVAPTPKP
jgi:hypothetical protein